LEENKSENHTNPFKDKEKLSIVPVKTALFPGYILDRVSRQHIISVGSLALIICWLITMLLWSKADFVNLLETNGWLLAIAKFCSLSGLTFLSLNFVLSSRIWFLERLFGGLDKVYKVHNIVGRTTWFLLTLHATFIITNTYLQTPDLVIPYLTPSLSWPQNLGSITLLLIDILLVLTIWVKMPYETWRITHKFMALPLLIGGTHAMLAGSDLIANPILRYWFLALIVTGFTAYIYRQIFYRFLGPRFRMRVLEVRPKGEVTEIYMKPLKKAFEFYPGQFMFVSFVKTAKNLKREMHPFSISGIGEDGLVRISPKGSGDYSYDLKKVREGDELLSFGPYGQFAERFLTTKKPMVWIAGGIGVTPFLSMLQYEAQKKKENGRKISMFYSITDEKEAVYDDEIKENSAGMSEFKYFIQNTSKDGRLDAEKIAGMLGGVSSETGKADLKKSLIFLCGPVPMMRAISGQLVKMGVRPSNIVYEEFALR
jgi:predicted ferric reductase